jgi:hypothetical protein
MFLNTYSLTIKFSGFFEKDGSCSFDFVKVSPDRSKLYVAVRFDSKTNAREVMEKYDLINITIGVK